MTDRLAERKRRGDLEKKIEAGLKPLGRFSTIISNGKTRFVAPPAEKILVEIDHNANTADIHQALVSFPQIAEHVEALLTSKGFSIERLA